MEPKRITLAELLAEAEALVERLTPEEAAQAVSEGAVVVDVRSAEARARDGVVPGSLHIPRTVLEWRLDPEGAWRTPHVAPGDRLVLVCDHGYSTVLAAANLVRLGVRAGDVVGGIEAWRAAGLPLAEADDAPLAAGEAAGMRPPSHGRP